MKVLITGGNGYIARGLSKGLLEYDVTLITRTDVDLENDEAVRKYFIDKYYDVIIHTAIVGGNRLLEEDENIIKSNLAVFNNLLKNKKHFGKFISFGSGAELDALTPYGISKKQIRNLILDTENFYNIRIYAVFDENELDRRFIKSNMIKYLNKQPMVIHQNKIMDLFYMGDLITLIKYYIENDILPKEIECSYSSTNKTELKDVCDIINKLSNYTVPIIIEKNDLDKPYYGCGLFLESLNLDLVGLEEGIKKTYISYK